MRKVVSLLILSLILCIMFSFLPCAHASEDVAESTNNIAVGYPHQRKVLRAAGLFWAFYCNGTHMLLKTSDDGLVWSDPTVITEQSVPDYFDVEFDGTYLHWVSAFPHKYRRGLPNSDGTITWSADEQSVSDLGWHVSLAVDSNGYAFVGYHGALHPMITKNANNDGTWQTDTANGFPYEFPTPDSHLWEVEVVALTDGKIYAIYQSGVYLGQNFNTTGSLWNGTAWEDPEIVHPYQTTYGCAMSAVAIGDNIHFVGQKKEPADEGKAWGFKYFKRTWGVGWGNEYTIHRYAMDVGFAISKSAETDDLYVFWTNTLQHKIEYVRYTNATGEWSITIDWITNALLNDKWCFTAAEASADEMLPILWMYGYSKPYTVKSDFLYTVWCGPDVTVNTTLVWKDWTNNILTVIVDAAVGNTTHAQIHYAPLRPTYVLQTPYNFTTHYNDTIQNLTLTIYHDTTQKEFVVGYQELLLGMRYEAVSNGKLTEMSCDTFLWRLSATVAGTDSKATVQMFTAGFRPRWVQVGGSFTSEWTYDSDTKILTFNVTTSEKPVQAGFGFTDGELATTGGIGCFFGVVGIIRHQLRRLKKRLEQKLGKKLTIALTILAAIIVIALIIWVLWLLFSIYIFPVRD